MAKQNNSLVALEQAKQEIFATESNFISAMLSIVPDTDDMVVKVGEKDLTDKTLKNVTVTAQTLQAFAGVSTKALCCKLSEVDTETAKHDGFKVMAFITGALPNLAPSTARLYYLVGRIFGDSATMTWRQPVPSSVSISNLTDLVKAKGLINTTKIEEATEKDLVARFEEFIRKYVDTGLIHLNATQKDLRAEIKAIQNPDKADIVTTAEDVTDTEQEQDTKSTDVPATEQEQEQDARLALDTLFTYFKGNDKVLEYLSLVLAEMPTEQEQETEQE